MSVLGSVLLSLPSFLRNPYSLAVSNRNTLFSEMIGYRTQALQEHVVRKVGKVVQVERKAS